MNRKVYHQRWQREKRYGIPGDGLPLVVCPACGTVFQPRNRRQIYHTKACGVAYKYRLARERTAEKRKRFVDSHAYIEDGVVLKIPLSGGYEGLYALADNTPENRRKLSEKVFSCDHYGYPMMNDGYRRPVHLHHLIFGKPEEGKVIDHINGDKLDCRFCNLREISRGENNYNQPERRHNTSGKTGVGYSKSEQKWYARISKDGRDYYLGSYNTFEDAVLAREKAESEFYGYKFKGSKRSARRKLRG